MKKPKKDNTYLRSCRRCKVLFRTPAKFGRICTDCSLSPGSKKK